MEDDDGWIRNALAVAAAGSDALFVLTTVYPETDPLNAGGQVLLHRGSGGGLTESVLSTASPLAAMWRSPGGHLWLGSADGSAWTTAPVPWARNGPAFDASGGPPWTTTRLPALATLGIPSNLTAVWGTSDTDVWFATATGSIYHWDGSAWQEFPAAQESLTKLHGRAPAEAYAVGYRGTIVHWDGRAWVDLPAPDIAAARTIVTGVAALSADDVFAATNRGELLKRAGAAFTLAQKVDGVRFTGMTPWGSGLALSSPTGAWFYDRRQLQHVKDNFSATDVQASGDRLYFIESEQPQGPACVEYVPGRTGGSPWQRLVF